MKKITFLMFCLLAGFTMQAQFASMAIVGDGVGGWPTGAAGEVDTHQMTSTDGMVWTIENLTTMVGSVKFRAENSWSNNWGGSTFPTGTAVLDSPTNIGTIVGTYDVTLDLNTMTYTFVSQSTFETVSLVGPGVVGGSWDDDTDMFTSDGENYFIYSVALDGNVKWRQNHDWAVNWGATAFPSGTAVQGNTDSVVVPAGVYNVTFNSTTGVYEFSFPTIALVGDATPQGWPVDPQTDEHQLTTTDGVNYSLATITLVDGGAKFRQNNAWNVNWGSAAFPSGTGTQGGSDIAVTAGTYGISFNRETGEYAFGAPASAETFANGNLAVFPNPTQNVWNITVNNGTIENVTVIDMLGKVVATSSAKGNTVAINAAALGNGMYIARITTDNGSKTVKLARN